MRKIFLTLLITFCGTFITFAQKSQLAIFVYNSNNTTPTNALRSQLTNSFLEGGKSNYNVVDRTDEMLNFLMSEYQYQGSGMVRDDQIISTGEHLAADYICAVSITYYSDYNQYFFDAKIVDVSARQIIKNTLYPSDEYTKIESLNPQIQLRVGKELAKQLDVFSSEQLIAQKLKIGDAINSENGDTYKIGYLDETGKHGLAYKLGKITKFPREKEGIVPTCEQLEILYKNRKKLGLNEEYWSCDPATHAIFAGIDAYYTLSFSTGKKIKRDYDPSRPVRSIFIFIF